jgi:hypothetical protein
MRWPVFVVDVILALSFNCKQRRPCLKRQVPPHRRALGEYIVVMDLAGA